MAAYTAVLGELAWYHGPAVIVFRQETYTLLLALVSLILAQKGRLEKAALLLVLAVTVEVTISFALSGLGPKTSSLGQVPVVILAAGLFLGARAALLWGFLLPLLSTAGAWAGARWWGGPPIDSSDTFYLIALWVGGIVTGALLHVFLNSFQQVLLQAKLSERRVSDLFRSAPDGLLVTGSDTAIEGANDQALALLGIESTELKTMRLIDVPVSAGNSQLDVEAAADLGEALEVLGTRTGIPLEMRVQHITSRGGQQGLLLLLRDITDRKVAERRQADLSAQLLHSQKLEAVGRLAGGVAHDFNNILTVVAGYADILATFPGDTAKVIARELQSTYERGANLTRQLLAFARRDIVQPRPIDLGGIVRETQRLITRLAGERIDVQFSIAPGCSIFADPGQLQQVVMNLASNAVDAMPEGGTLRIGTGHDGEFVTLEVEDDGLGIPDEVRGKIFEPFFTTKVRGKGTGLGLATVHGIVMETKGTIDLDSKVGEGTRLRIVWQRTEEQLEAPRQEAGPVLLQKGSGDILLAEDDEQTRTFIHRALSEHGFRVTAVTEGSEALALIRSNKSLPDLLIADVVMPAMTGTELAARIRDQHPELSVLFISGYTDDQLSPDLLDERTDFLRKPFGQTELLDRVMARLGRRP